MQKKFSTAVFNGRNAFLLFFFFLCLNHSVVAQGFLKANGQQITDGKGNNILLRGIGLGGWMLQEGYMLRVNGHGPQHSIRQRIEALIGKTKTAAFYDAWLANHTTRADIDSLRAWGFNSVRLPMHYNLYTLPVEQEPVAGKQTWLTKGFAMTDSLLQWCKANKMYLILDLHAAPGGQGNDLNIADRDTTYPNLWQSEANRQKTIALWEKLAERYKDEPWIGGYDILNEPNYGFTDPAGDRNGIREPLNQPLKELMMAITTAIRKIDQKHIIIIEGNGWGNNYRGILPPWDKNMVLSFHRYWNFNDKASIGSILEAREKYNVPVWLGETGENSNVWFTQAINLLETNNIGWAWWPLKKLGNNNPLEIKSNPAYERVLRYWNNNGPKPSAEEAAEGLTELAASLQNSKNIIHYDVLDAMFRQPFSTATKPFRLHQVKSGTVIAAVDYDLGRNGYAYADQDTADYHVSTGQRGAGNRGRMYRNDGVDISRDSATGDFYISHTQPGEWVQYTIEVTEPGTYQLEFSIAAKEAGSLILSVNGSNSRSLALPAGETGRWHPAELKNVQLNRGKQVIKVQVEQGGFLLKNIRFLKSV
ncbi:cellulase family glycosylhydrolase [Sediminibacterium ginsengisoli]|uniref:Cellulase (Glycosyl hydrolase family 5) n=1 Tax=Sediminibacterium ginsengisoli TaxID=413434 RepID=A0A1T4Q3V2_9BACT|nr:cellulase family glycosylhydrolase [Sediminibacterium ginsengisoli]SJZ97888.1 Cellulase (glycosyl hydrolase family 5) [Sediminibacterium ginsengisoli]